MHCLLREWAQQFDGGLWSGRGSWGRGRFSGSVAGRTKKVSGAESGKSDADTDKWSSIQGFHGESRSLLLSAGFSTQIRRETRPSSALVPMALALPQVLIRQMRMPRAQVSLRLPSALPSSVPAFREPHTGLREIRSFSACLPNRRNAQMYLTEKSGH